MVEAGTQPAAMRALAALGLLACGLLAFGLNPAARADTHIYVGATGTNLHDRLSFTVAALFDTRSGYRLPMALRSTGLNAGHYRGDTLTFTALSASDLGTGQVPGRALFGSRLGIQVVRLEGPAEGALAFWDGDGENPGDRVTFRVPTGTVHGTNTFVISENDGAPGSDPYGHIHGREFTTTAPGLYTVGFRAVDLSTNGPGGGPLHAPSEVLDMYLQAGPTLEQVATTAGGVRISFRSAPGVTNRLESCTDLGTRAWNPVGPLVRGNSTLQSIVDTNAPDPGRFYRLRWLHVPP